jgi:CheY-like chemotaxis protein
MTKNISTAKILIAEDSKPIRLVLKTYINQLGIEPDFAETGTEALNKINSLKYDLIFLDIKLPEMSGLEIICNLRKNGIKTKTIAITADEDPKLLSTCLESGFNSFIIKPVPKEDLFHIIKTSCKLN